MNPMVPQLNNAHPIETLPNNSLPLPKGRQRRSGGPRQSRRGVDLKREEQDPTSHLQDKRVSPPHDYTPASVPVLRPTPHNSRLSNASGRDGQGTQANEMHQDRGDDLVTGEIKVQDKEGRTVFLQPLGLHGSDLPRLADFLRTMSVSLAGFPTDRSIEGIRRYLSRQQQAIIERLNAGEREGTLSLDLREDLAFQEWAYRWLLENLLAISQFCPDSRSQYRGIEARIWGVQQALRETLLFTQAEAEPSVGAPVTLGQATSKITGEAPRTTSAILGESRPAGVTSSVPMAEAPEDTIMVVPIDFTPAVEKMRQVRDTGAQANQVEFPQLVPGSCLAVRVDGDLFILFEVSQDKKLKVAVAKRSRKGGGVWHYRRATLPSGGQDIGVLEELAFARVRSVFHSPMGPRGVSRNRGHKLETIMVKPPAEVKGADSVSLEVDVEGDGHFRSLGTINEIWIVQNG